MPDRDPFFVGRSDELGQLGESLAVGGVETVVTQVAAGMGGVGKTSLVVEFCHLYRDEFEVVRWLVADDRQSLVERFLAAAPALGVSIDGLDVGDAVARVRSWFEQTERDWLLVFDNADDPSVLEGLIPNAGVGSVVVTSRQQDWNSQGIEPLRLGVLDSVSAIDLLEKRSGRSGDVDAGGLVDYLGCLALAVSQAAAYCSEQDWSFGRYLQMLQDRPGRLFAANKADLQAVDGSDKVMLTVWDASVEQAVRRAGNARDVLNVLSFYAADGVPRGLIVSESIARSLEVDVLDVEEALGALKRFSLVSENEIGLLSMHRLTQEVTRTVIGNEVETEFLGYGIDGLRAVHPTDLVTPESWRAAEPFGSHVLSVVSHSERLEAHRADAGGLLDRHATSIRNEGEPLRAVPLFERAKNLAVSELDGEHPDTLRAWSNLAVSYWSAGRTSEAIEIEERVAEVSERLLGGEHPSTLTRWSNLASSYQAAGRTSEAIEIFERVAEVSERLLGGEHPDTLISWANLASSYQAAGRTGDFEKVVETKIGWLIVSNPEELDPALANLRSQLLGINAD